MITGTINGIEVHGSRPILFMDEIQDPDTYVDELKHPDGTYQSSRHHWMPIVLRVDKPDMKNSLIKITGNCTFDVGGTLHEQWLFTGAKFQPLDDQFVLLTYTGATVN